MRSIFTHVLAALLIVMLAIGAAIPAKADCLGADGCKSAAAGMADGSCGLKGEPCKVAQMRSTDREDAGAGFDSPFSRSIEDRVRSTRER